MKFQGQSRIFPSISILNRGILMQILTSISNSFMSIIIFQAAEYPLIYNLDGYIKK